MKSGAYYSQLEKNKVLIYDLNTGDTVEEVVDGNKLKNPLKIDNYTFSPDEKKLLLMTGRKKIYRYSYTAVFYIYDRATKSIKPLAKGLQAYATFSSTSEKVAYTQDNNLHYYDLINGKHIQVTDDGETNAIINGSTDWVYEEELIVTKAFSWSPDGNRLAYYRFDERHVKEFTIQMWTATSPYPYDYTYKYPKAGEENSKVELYVYELQSKKKQRVKLGGEKDTYVARMQWTLDPYILSVERLNRLQNRRDILHIDARTGNSTQVLSEKSDTYVDLTFCDDLYYLKDGKHFVYSSEESGYKHLYLYTLSGKRIRDITSGSWEVSEVLGVDEKSRRSMIYYLSTEGGFMERYLYRVPIKGGDKELQSKKKGVYSINMSSDCSYYISNYSSPTSPPEKRLYRSKDNRFIRVIQDNSTALQNSREKKYVEKEFFSFTSKGSNLLYGYLLKPEHTEEGKKYPLLVYQYSGPGSQQVRKNWGGSFYTFHQELVKKGIVVAVVDTRGTGGRGAEFKKLTYGQLGRYESEDLHEAARYLAQLPYVDSTRMGIWGWSYGGYMSSLSLFMPSSPYSLAVAVAPVGSWRFYDTIYTERYMKRPQENASGYDNYSPIHYASSMQGKYLLIHGTGDDNVHFQNAIAIQDALIQANKQFSTFYYPNQPHNMGDATPHLLELVSDFIEKNL